MKVPLLSVENLTVEFLEKGGNAFYALNSVSLKIEYGEIFGLIGESGAGKTVLANSIMGLLEGYPGIINGKIILRGKNLLDKLPSYDRNRESMIRMNIFNKWRKKHQHQMKGIRGINIGMVFQEPFKSMDPLFKVREHVIESIKKNKPNISDMTMNDLVIDWLKSVQLENPEKVQNQYVFELSGGMIQRVMISVALASNPPLIIADEPTTALDTITQKKILDLIQQLSKKHGLSLLFITHDLGIAVNYFDRLAVIVGGRIVETGTREDVTKGKWRHPYTDELLNAAVGKSSDDLGHSRTFISSDTPGCIFAKRCKLKKESCSEKDPPMIEAEKNHFIKCWKYQGS